MPKSLEQCEQDEVNTDLMIAIKIYLGSQGKIVGSAGLVKLLEEIARGKSIRNASLKLGMNYRKAWSKLSQAEKKLGIKLVIRGRGRQGTKLTREAEKLLEMYYDVLHRFDEMKKESRFPIKIIG